jgi:hypothetical protein
LSFPFSNSKRLPGGTRRKLNAAAAFNWFSLRRATASILEKRATRTRLKSRSVSAQAKD